jgi:2-polyprenyl-6-hydroxyphenyl methylase/3-demethylubiquinone-9 3-methyltransferase
MSTSANVDHHEIDKFSRLAHRWWDPESEFKPLHEINPLRLGFIDRIAPLAGQRVVDVGCGGGILSEGMARLGAEVTGIDMGEEPLSVARLHLYESGLTIDYQQSTAEAFALEQPASFDIVTCMEMLEHVPDPESVVAACARLVRPGGRLFFSTINRKPKAYLMAILGAEYLLGMLPRGTHDYARFIQPAELESWSRAAGITIDQLSGMGYNPFTRDYYLGRDLSVNYLAAAYRPV